MIYKPSVSERIFDISNYIFLALLSFVMSSIHSGMQL